MADLKKKFLVNVHNSFYSLTWLQAIFMKFNESKFEFLEHKMRNKSLKF